MKLLIAVGKRVIAYTFLIYFGFGAVLYLFQERLIFIPDRTAFKDCSGERINKYIQYKSTRMYQVGDSEEQAVYYYHGNAGRACDRLYLTDVFTNAGYTVYFVEYTGYAESENNPSRDAIIQNVNDVISYINTNNYQKTVVIGESIGTGAAAYHARESGADQLVLITPFDSLQNVIREIYPFYPIGLLLRNEFNVAKMLQNYENPITIIAAQHDEIMSATATERLINSLSTSTTVSFIESASHNTWNQFPEFYTTLKEAIR